MNNLMKTAWFLFPTLCLFGLTSPQVWAQAAGEPGGPCLPNNICQTGASCFKTPQGGTICLLPAVSPGTNSNSALLQECPPRHRYLSCPSDGGNCQLRCIFPKGFGCEAAPHASLELFLLALALLSALALVRLQRSLR